MVMNLRELPASFLMIRNYDCCMEAKGFKVMQPESSESPGYSIAQQPLDSEVNSCSTPGFAVGRCSLVTYKPPSRCQTPRCGDIKRSKNTRCMGKRGADVARCLKSARNE